MTDAGWAEKAVNKVMERLDCSCQTCASPGCQKLLQAEHARSMRIVKAEIKRVMMDQHTFTAGSKESVLNELQYLLEKFERGRGGKG